MTPPSEGVCAPGQTPAGIRGYFQSPPHTWRCVTMTQGDEAPTERPSIYKGVGNNPCSSCSLLAPPFFFQIWLLPPPTGTEIFSGRDGPLGSFGMGGILPGKDATDPSEPGIRPGGFSCYRSSAHILSGELPVESTGSCQIRQNRRVYVAYSGTITRLF